MSRRLRVGIVGCGRILNAHLNGYQDLLEHGVQDFEIVALCARNIHDAERYVARGGLAPRSRVTAVEHDPLNAPHVYVSDLFPDADISLWTDAHRMIAEADIDVVDVTASVLAHDAVAIAGASQGKHVMVQKPMAISLVAGKTMINAAETAGVVLAVMEDMHYQAHVKMARWLVQRGLLGTIQMTVAAYLGTQQWSPDSIVAGTPWRHRLEEAGGGISFDLGVHFFQHLRQVCGPIRRVYGGIRTFEPVRYTRDAGGLVLETVQATADDTMFCLVEFADGGLGQLSASWAGHGLPTEVPGGMVIYGSKGCLRGDTLYLDGCQPESLQAYFDEHVTAAEREGLFPLGITNPFAQAYFDFFAAIRQGRRASYDGHEGLIDLAWSAAVTESSKQRRPCSAQDMIDAVGEKKGVMSR